MSMDFETVRFMRVLFAIVFGAVGGAGGIKYFIKIRHFLISCYYLVWL